MSREQVSRDDWTQAALEALGEQGVSAVRVDVLARRLGVTRGSFYWHFKDRDGLITAALERWELICTTEVIEQLERIADPAERLRKLLTVALGQHALSRVEPAIVAHADHPIIASTLRRVADRRVSFLTKIYREFGLSPTVARRQALVAYATHVGWLQLRRAAPDVLPEVAGEGAKGKAAVHHMTRQLIDGPATVA